MVEQNKYYSYNIGELPKGCQYCVRGEKLVVFVTGLCPRKCYFCPISDKKAGKDVSFANEKKVVSADDLILEAENMKARGAGITGGDPLTRIERTVEYILALKKKFGKNFHVHLYTSLNLVTKEILQKLHDAGLDEIRFHLDLDSKEFWEKLNLAKNFKWDIGVEVPLIFPKYKETKELIDYIHDKVSFLNLNELEMADNSISKLGEMGFYPKEELSYAVKGSLEFGLGLLLYIQNKKYNLKVHLCTAKLKDKIQLTNRIKREGKYTKRNFDILDEEGLLTRGALYLPELMPGFNYMEKLEKIDKTPFIKKLKDFTEKIKKDFRIREDMIFLDLLKPRILISKNNILKFKKRFIEVGLRPAVVKEYPTADEFEVEIEFFQK